MGLIKKSKDYNTINNNSSSSSLAPKRIHIHIVNILTIFSSKYIHYEHANIL